MILTLELHPDLEAALLKQAEARGVSLEMYVVLVLRERLQAPERADDLDDESFLHSLG